MLLVTNQVIFLFFLNIIIEYKQVKCDITEKNSQGASDERFQTVFVLKCCMSLGQSLSGNVA